MPTLTTLVNFNGTDGDSSTAGLIADAAGDLFGTTFSGGANNDGTVFEIAKTSTGYASTPTILVNFNGTHGNRYALIADAAGDLFGMTRDDGGDGTAFEITKTGGSYASAPTTLASLNGTNGGLIADAAGDLFGTTSVGGANNDGMVFEIAKTGTGYAGTPTTLASFNGTDGSDSGAGLIADAAGDLFGTTVGGGANNDGTVFEIAKTVSGYASTPTTLASFNGTNGDDSEAGLIADAAGDLFGTTAQGGANNDGTVFEIAKTVSGYASTPTTLVSFDGADGQYPDAGLIVDAAGDLFGTIHGGANNDGTVFEIAKTGGGYAGTPTILVNFNGTNGGNPVGGLIADAAGDLFGTTSAGGTNGGGTVFELTGTGFQVTPTISYSISPNPASVNEDAGTLTFTITRSNSSAAATVYASTVQDQGYTNAATGTTSTSYYYGGLVNVPYTFAAGQNQIQVPITINDHGLTSGSEKFSLEMQDSSGTELASTTFTIANTDTTTTTYSVSPSPAAVNENAGTLIFTVSRSDDSQQQTVDVSTVQDQGYYNALSGSTSTNYYYDGLDDASFTFAAGQSSIQVPITINDTGLTPGSEKFSLDVQSTSGANLASTTFTILNSDPAPAVLNTPPSDIPPTVQAPSSLSEVANTWLVDFGSSVQGNDADGAVASYQFTDVSGAGFFTLGGIRTGNVVTVPASQLTSLGFNVGSTVGTDQIQIEAIDNQGATSTPLNVALNVMNHVNPAAAPNAATLADLSLDVYNNQPLGADGYAVVPYDVQGDTVDDIDGFQAVVYANSDHSQVVIAFKGTNPQDLENLIADGSWVGLPIGELQEYFDFAVYLLGEAQTLYPSAAISLTGHSLGGAIAELLGEASHLPVTAFDAPGAQDFYQTLLDKLSSEDPTTASQLADERSQRPSHSDTNYRLYGDLVSTVGSPIGTAVTLPWPGDPNDLNILDHHSLTLLDTQVHGFVQGQIPALPNGVDEPGNAPEIVATALGGISASVNALEAYFADPPGNSDFVLTEAQGSPLVTSIELPILPGVQSYEIRYETGSSWSTFQQVWPEQWQAPSAGVDGVEFIPLDSTGHSVSVSDSIMFGMVFGTTGTINATLNSSALNAVFGGPGDDTLVGSSSADLLVDGGLGYNEYNLSGIASTSVTITRSNGETIISGIAGSYTDTLLNIQEVVFSDKTIFLQAPASDFTGDGLSDLIWQNGTTFTEWQSNSNNTLTQNVDVGSVGAGWTLAGAGDFNGDGKADLIWQNGTTFTEWQSTGNSFTQNVDVGSVGAGWALAGTGDFNGDGKADLIWQNGTTFAEWQSTGSSFTQNIDVGSVGAGWNIATVGDFNGDGNADLIWQNGTTFTEWQSTGNAFTQNVDVGSVGAGWNIVGSGDFNGDGKTDLIWENGGAFSEWQSTGNGFTQNAYVGSLGSGWSVAAIGDFNGDGMSDILFRNTNGTFTEWQSTGTGFTQNVLVNSSVGTAWSLEYSPSKTSA